MTPALHCVRRSAGVRRFPAAKREIIDLVEHSALPVSRTLEEMDIQRSSFHRWYQQYQIQEDMGLELEQPKRHQLWNRLPDPVCEQVVQLALVRPKKSTLQLAWFFTAGDGSFVSESSVYRLLKDLDLVETPAFQLITAANRFA